MWQSKYQITWLKRNWKSESLFYQVKWYRLSILYRVHYTFSNASKEDALLGFSTWMWMKSRDHSLAEYEMGTFTYPAESSYYVGALPRAGSEVIVHKQLRESCVLQALSWHYPHQWKAKNNQLAVLILCVWFDKPSNSKITYRKILLHCWKFMVIIPFDVRF